MLEGLDQVSSGLRQTFVQISGAGVYGHLSNPHRRLDHVYDDENIDDMNSVSDTAPHRAGRLTLPRGQPRA